MGKLHCVAFQPVIPTSHTVLHTRQSSHQPQTESFCLADNVLLGSRIDKVLSFTGKVIVLTPEVGNKPQAECARHPNREQLCHPGEAAGITHRRIRTVIFTLSFHRLQLPGSKRRQERILQGSILQGYIAQAGKAFRTTGRGTYTEVVGACKFSKSFIYFTD